MYKVGKWQTNKDKQKDLAPNNDNDNNNSINSW